MAKLKDEYFPKMRTNLELEAKKLTSLLGNKKVSEIYRHRESELCIEFSDGSRLFVNCNENRSLELSITGCREH